MGLKKEEQRESLAISADEPIFMFTLETSMKETFIYKV